MATIRLQPPDRFDFKSPDIWPKWRRRFEQFRTASGLSAASAAQQVNTLLYCLGEEADDVLSSTNITDAERLVYDTVLQKFDDFFEVRRNVIFERARFNRRNQLDGESSEKYITELYSLIDGCNYGDLKEEMLRDRLVVGIKDQELSEKLQLDPDLTLEKAKKTDCPTKRSCEGTAPSAKRRSEKGFIIGRGQTASLAEETSEQTTR